MRQYYKQRFLSRYFLMEETKKIPDTLKFHSELLKIVVRDFTIAWFEKESLIYRVIEKDGRDLKPL